MIPKLCSLERMADSARKTRDAWNMFKRFTNHELAALLTLAGVAPCEDRGLMLHQALIVWFHGFIPNVTEVTYLSQELKG